MQISDIQNPAERNKLILAGVLAIVALLFLWWTFFGFGSSSKPGAPRAGSQPSPSAGSRSNPNRALPQTIAEFEGTDPGQWTPVNISHSPVLVPPAKRNIFAYYLGPPKPPVVEQPIPTPTPTPVPPVLLANLSPANVFARTADFTLEVSGDKFTPQLRVVIENTELPIRYINPQQLSATVPAALIANPGAREVMLKSADGKLYSNSTTLSIAAAPTPNYSYIGIIGTHHFVADTAILLDKANKETLSVQRGDLVGGRFRVTSISEKEVVFIDPLKIKHTLTISAQGDKGNPLQRPTPRVESEDDEP